MCSTAPARATRRSLLESAQVTVSCPACQQTADGYVCDPWAERRPHPARQVVRMRRRKRA